MLRQQRKQYLGSRTHLAAMRHMTAEHPTTGIGDGHVEMRAVRRHRPGDSQYFEVPTKFSREIGSGKPQLRDAKTADTLDDEGRAQRTFAQDGFNGGAQVIAGIQAQRKDLHGRS